MSFSKIPKVVHEEVCTEMQNSGSINPYHIYRASVKLCDKKLLYIYTAVPDLPPFFVFQIFQIRELFSVNLRGLGVKLY